MGKKQPPVWKATISPSEIEVAECAIACHGNISRMADVLGMWRQNLHRWLNNHPEVKQLVREQRKLLRDKILGVFYENALDPDPRFQTTRIFYLKTQCGWRETSEDEAKAAPASTPQIHVYIPDNKRSET